MATQCTSLFSLKLFKRVLYIYLYYMIYIYIYIITYMILIKPSDKTLAFSSYSYPITRDQNTHSPNITSYKGKNAKKWL